MYLKGKTQAAPEVAVQVAGVRDSWEQEEEAARSQSPHWLVTTEPSLDTCTHQSLLELLMQWDIHKHGKIGSFKDLC